MIILNDSPLYPLSNIREGKFTGWRIGRVSKYRFLIGTSS